MKALGMIEVYGYLAAVEALDSALKAADVHLLNFTLVKGGLVTVLVTGDVGAIRAAMDASSAAAERVGKIVSVHVIPRPAESIEAMLSQKKQVVEKKQPEVTACVEMKQTEVIESAKEKEAEVIESVEVKQPEVTASVEMEQKPLISKEAETQENKLITEEKKQENKEEKPVENSKTDTSAISVETMQGMTVENLRNLARKLGITNLTRKEIKFANKKQLIQSISKFFEQER